MENNGSPPRPTSHGPAPYDPTAALADVDSARRAVADRLITPWWYHPTLGAILAAIMLTAALNLSNIVRLPVALIGAAGIGLLIAGYQRTTGLWVDLRNLGPISRRWWLAYAAVVLVVLVISFWPTATDQALPLWLAIALAAVAVIAQIVLGRRIDDAMRAEIRAGTAVAPRRR